MELRGTSMIGSSRGRAHAENSREESRAKKWTGLNPVTGEAIGPDFYSASSEELNQAVTLADEAFDAYSRTSGARRAEFLRLIAQKLEERIELLASRVMLETGLPLPRVQSETQRTCHQLRMFANLVEDGFWVDARREEADPSRRPLPKPALYSVLRPLGPVAVFCASNFPIAFSVAGGDTASALAAGNPVVVLAHSAHPGTAEIVGTLIQEAVKEAGLPEGVFSLIYDSGYERGEELVKHPLIRAVGFTGSRKGGLALRKFAVLRPEPIPFYAEMSSLNPVFILPEAMSQRAEDLAEGFFASVTLGSGQFCTKPGLLVAQEGEAFERFRKKLAALVREAQEFTLLTPQIQSNYLRVVSERKEASGLVYYESVNQPSLGSGCQVAPCFFEGGLGQLLENLSWREEVFGPSSLMAITSAASNFQTKVLMLVKALEGQLTATVFGTETELPQYQSLFHLLERKAGRLVLNGFPTGVEVNSAIVHGGPFPSTSDGLSSSVGTRAIFRFCRPVCFQNFPPEFSA